jgi:hypothetical protein
MERILTPKEIQINQEIKTLIENYAKRFINPDGPVKPPAEGEFVTINISQNRPNRFTQSGIIELQKIKIWQKDQKTIISIFKSGPSGGYLEISTLSKIPDVYISLNKYCSNEHCPNIHKKRLEGAEALAKIKEFLP